MWHFQMARKLVKTLVVTHVDKDMSLNQKCDRRDSKEEIDLSILSTYRFFSTYSIPEEMQIYSWLSTHSFWLSTTYCYMCKR